MDKRPLSRSTMLRRGHKPVRISLPLIFQVPPEQLDIRLTIDRYEICAGAVRRQPADIRTLVALWRSDPESPWRPASLKYLKALYRRGEVREAYDGEMILLPRSEAHHRELLDNLTSIY